MSLSVHIDEVTLADVNTKPSTLGPCKRRRDRQTHTRRMRYEDSGRVPCTDAGRDGLMCLRARDLQGSHQMPRSQETQRWVSFPATEETSPVTPWFPLQPPELGENNYCLSCLACNHPPCPGTLL